MNWILVATIIVLLLLLITISYGRRDSGTKNTGPIIVAAFVVLLLGALGTLFSMLITP